MKKLLSIVIAAMLVLACTVSAFAVQTPAGASDDEADKTVTSIKFTTLPTKTEYIFDMNEEAGIDLSDMDDFDLEDEDVFDEYFKSHFYINVDLAGAILEATYSDGTKGNADLSLCKTSVADPPSIFDETFARDYTINVEYKGAKTTLTVKIVDGDFPDYESNYEVVSITKPLKTVYTMEDTFTDNYYDEETGEFINDIFFDIDTTGMTVVLKDKTTGELITVTEENIVCDTIFVDSENPYGEYEVSAGAIVETENTYDMVEFNFNVTFAESESTQPTVAPTTGATSSTAEESSTADTVDNGTVQTGNEMSAVVLAVLMLSGVAVAVFCTRKRLEK